jgi:hypothetical protein
MSNLDEKLDSSKTENEAKLTEPVNEDEGVLTERVNEDDEIEIQEEVVEVNVEELVRELESQHGEVATRFVKFEEIVSQSSEVDKLKFKINFILASICIAVAVAALIVSLAKTELTIGQGELYVEGGVVNEMLGNLIRNDLAARLPREVNVRDVKIKVVLYGGENSESYSKVSDIGDTDTVSAEVMLMPRDGIMAFSEDVRIVLDVMQAQSAEQGIVYDEIMFVAEDALTRVHAELSGRFSMDISVDEIAAITYYFGDVDLDWENDDIEDIEDIEDLEN